VLLVKSADPMGANYVVVRDVIKTRPKLPPTYWNLWCVADKPTVTGNVVHFPGRYGVDLDVHVLSPARPDVQIDQWAYKQHIYVWGPFSSAQYGMHVPSADGKGYLAVLYPRGKGQAAAKVSVEADGKMLRIQHSEGTDYVRLSPGGAVAATVEKVSLTGEVAMARVETGGGIRLAVVKGKAGAAVGEWTLASDGPTAVTVRGKAVIGESSGQAHVATLTLPAKFGPATVTLDGKSVKAPAGRTIRLELPEGSHRFTVQAK